MAKTPNPLVWEFYRSVDGVQGLGGVAHYWDETSQSLWLSSGIKTNLAEVPEGHWETAEVQSAVDIGTPKYDSLSLDHPYNGVLFGSAMLDGELFYIRHVYAMDCSDIISSGQLGLSNNNAVVQLKASLMNIKEAIFTNDATVFQPGARVIFNVVAGDEIPLEMCASYLDSVDFDARSLTVPISGRNNIGFKLMQSTFDDDMKITGLPHEVAQTICYMAGIPKLLIQSMDEQREYEFKADQTLMSGLEQICGYYPGWKVMELPSGAIVMGPPNYINSHQGNGYYVFEKGSVFKRKTKRSCDAAYTKVRITGKDAEGNDLTPAVIPVKYYSQWGLPPNKTYHEKIPDGYTQEELEAYAESIAETLQYVGVGEDFTGSFQPQLSIGDVAAVDNGDGTMTALGLVTSIKHSFGKSGFTTDFSTDSGGILMETMDSDANIITVTKPLNGYNRKQTLKDLIQVATGSSRAGPQASGNVIRITSGGNGNATTFCGKTYDEVVAEAVDAALKIIQTEVILAEQEGDVVTIYGAHKTTQVNDTLEVT